MSDETASQIEYLIEITQQDFELKAALLEDNVEGDILVAELLQDIKLDVSDIKEGLFQFFEEEQDRFAIQQGLSKEQYFRTLEALREGAGQGDQQAPAGSGEGDDGDGSTGRGGAIAGAIAGSAAAGGLGRLGSLVFRRIPQLAIVAGAIAAGVDYFAEYETQLKKFKEEGIDPDTAMKEAAAQAAGELAADFSDVIVEPIANLGLDLLADEMGMTPEEVKKFRESIADLDSTLRGAMLSFADSVTAFFGDESVLAAKREDEADISELQQEITDAKAATGLSEEQIQTGIARSAEVDQRIAELEQIPDSETSGERRMRKAQLRDLRREQRELEPISQIAEAQTSLRQAQQGSELSQAGYEAGDLQTAGQVQFSEEVPSAEKEKFFEDNMEPLLKEAIQAGALDRSEFTEFLNFGGAADYSIPVTIEDLDALSNLSAPQLEAILVNDDILNKSFSQLGALETSDRKIVEYLYRMKTEQAADPRTQLTTNEVPQLDLGGTIEPGQAAIVGEKGPELVLGPAEVVGREDTSRIFDLLEPSPAVSAIVPVGDMSRNVAATSSAPIVISSTQGGSTVNNMVNNNSTTVLGGGAPARSSDVAHRRLTDRMQGVV